MRLQLNNVARLNMFLKISGVLYLQHLKNQRNALAAKPKISTQALKLIDQKISYFEEKTRIGVFKNATPQPLLVNETRNEETNNEQPIPIDIETE